MISNNDSPFLLWNCDNNFHFVGWTHCRELSALLFVRWERFCDSEKNAPQSDMKQWLLAHSIILKLVYNVINVAKIHLAQYDSEMVSRPSWSRPKPRPRSVAPRLRPRPRTAVPRQRPRPSTPRRRPTPGVPRPRPRPALHRYLKHQQQWK